MDEKQIKNLTAPCGIDCFNCEIHENNITTELRGLLASKLHIPKAEIACSGCRSGDGCKLFKRECETKKCVDAKGLEFCFECDDFPCFKLLPAREGAERFPHNYKLFNLCRIKKLGLKKWADEEATKIRKLYFRGIFVPGLGPNDDNLDKA